MSEQHEDRASERLERRRESWEREQRLLKRRYRRDFRFRLYTVAALLVAGAFLFVFLADLTRRAFSALVQTEIQTMVTYSAETVADPVTAFPEEVRDLVSHSRVREISREGRRAEINVVLHFDSSVARSPAAAIKSLTLEADDFPIFMQEEAPRVISREHLLLLIDKQGLKSIQEEVRNDKQLVGRSEPRWLRGSAALQQFLTDSTGLDDAVKESAESLDYTGKLRLEFNRAEFGDGMTTEQWTLAEADIDQYVKGKYSEVGFRADEYERLMQAIDEPLTTASDLATLVAACQRLREQQEAQSAEKLLTVPNEEQLQLYQAGWQTRQRIDALREDGRIRLTPNHYFLFNGDSKLPEAAGMKSAIFGSVYVLVLVFVICVPIGVLTSIYLEEFATDNWLSQLIEININNLAAIPSILFGVLGLAAMINFFGLPRASVLVGGATLALMTLPIIIISSRAALRAVPDSVRMAGFSMGATRWQVVMHHVLPASTSGIMTGSIIGIAQAMGETAPLIIVGLVAFVPDAPISPLDAATVMPAQIFSWWEMPQRAFEERAALAILLLLCVLFVLNGLALIIRARSERRW